MAEANADPGDVDDEDVDPPSTPDDGGGDGAPFSFTLAGEQAGQRLDKVLSALLPEHSRSRLQALIRSGDILVRGKPAKPGQETSAGDVITGAVPPDRPAEAQPQDIPLDALYEDADLAVINKACGMVVHPAAGNADGTLVNALLFRFGAMSSIGGVQRPGIVHRLDKETSGCLVTARSDTTHRALTEQFAGREVTKTYLAVTQGVPSPRSGTVKTHIARDPRDRLRMAVVNAPAGKYAHTDYTVLHTSGGDALVRCDLHTGRTHQIRVHMKHTGHPLLGDTIYARTARQSRSGRLMLHAWKLAFTHPRTGERMAFTAPVPPEFRPWIPVGGLEG